MVENQFFQKISVDLSAYNFRSEISKFRARRSKNYEAYTAYMLNNFCEVGAEIWKLQQKGYKGTGLILMKVPDTDESGKRLKIPHEYIRGDFCYCHSNVDGGLDISSNHTRAI